MPALAEGVARSPTTMSPSSTAPTTRRGHWKRSADPRRYSYKVVGGCALRGKRRRFAASLPTLPMLDNPGDGQPTAHRPTPRAAVSGDRCRGVCGGMHAENTGI